MQTDRLWAQTMACFSSDELLRDKTRNILAKRLFSLAEAVQVQLLLFLRNPLILHIFPYYILACMFSHARYERSPLQNFPHKTFFTSGCSTNIRLAVTLFTTLFILLRLCSGVLCIK